MARQELDQGLDSNMTKFTCAVANCINTFAPGIVGGIVYMMMSGVKDYSQLRDINFMYMKLLADKPLNAVTGLTNGTMPAFPVDLWVIGIWGHLVIKVK